MLCSGAEARGCSKNEKTAVLQTAAHKRSRFLPVLFLWGEKGRAGLLYCSRRSSAYITGQASYRKLAEECDVSFRQMIGIKHKKQEFQ